MAMVLRTKLVEKTTTDEPGNNNEDVDNGDGEDNFQDGVGDGTGDDENIVETSTGYDAGNEDGSEEDMAEEETTNGDESNGESISTGGFGPGSGPHERRKRFLAENNRRTTAPNTQTFQPEEAGERHVALQAD